MGIKKLSCFFILMFVWLYAKAKHYTNCETKYFVRIHMVSTAICYDKDKKLGKAIAYDIHGKAIYQRSVRRIYGSAGVAFSYYETGAVKTANYHSQPEGGIQWDNTITYFSPEGIITREEDYGYNKIGHVLAPPVQTSPAK